MSNILPSGYKKLMDLYCQPQKADTMAKKIKMKFCFCWDWLRTMGLVQEPFVRTDLFLSYAYKFRRHAAFCTILPWTRVTHYLNQPRQKMLCQKTPMDRPIKVPSWWGNNWLHSFSCSHRAPAHGKTFFFYSYFHIKPFWWWHYNYRWHGINSTLVIAFFALAGLVIPLLTLLKMTAFPFWISESRTPISEPVKLFFLRLDATLMTQHSILPCTGERKRSLIWYYFGRGVCKFTIFVHVHLNTHGLDSSFTQVVYILFPKLRAFVESDVACSYETFLRKK